MSDYIKWSVRAGSLNGHDTITESTTGLVACGETHCTGVCGLPALIHVPSWMTDEHRAVGHEYMKAHGIMAACGPVWNWPTTKWHGQKVEATLKGGNVDELEKAWWWGL